ncbi:MAG: hypothetical protein K5880_14170 [Hydrogenophaga sp.]|uniref:hypothetical protein n=1 Tax=Hydrogenophaga sp. TaxID=1904254 RepID=UPI002609467B|nr:hypothetical protein [Hydrogenophaga sp.]MCV0439769.1 hypothetical protein [Hydrogenophaga sp.]
MLRDYIKGFLRMLREYATEERYRRGFRFLAERFKLSGLRTIIGGDKECRHFRCSPLDLTGAVPTKLCYDCGATLEEPTRAMRIEDDKLHNLDLLLEEDEFHNVALYRKTKDGTLELVDICAVKRDENVG